MARPSVVAFSVSALLILGCANLAVRQIPSRMQGPAECREFLKELDVRVEWAGVRDAAGYILPNFPYLRTGRFVSAVGENLKNPQQRQQWLDLMHRLDLDAREKEIRNLPAATISREHSAVRQASDRQRLYASLKTCSDNLLAHDRTRSGFFEILQPQIQVPDEYSTLMRIAGLYPIMAIPVAAASEGAREKIKVRFNKDIRNLPVTGVLKSYAPPETVSVSGKEIAAILARSENNPLKIPILERTQEQNLAAALAPVLIQDVAATYDVPGRVVRAGDAFSVDTSRPTVYYYTSYAILHDRPVLQLNYVVWYSERAGRNSPRIERGHLDGLTFRLSLDNDGEVFMVDIMNNCGCYHFFVPNKEKIVSTKSGGLAFGPLVPQWLPRISPASRLGIRVNSGWHQVERLMVVAAPAGATSYDLVPYGTLESIPDKQGRQMSLFDEDGIARGSERIERYILFSMGIPSNGSMRQRGHHPIELIGRTHFDDPRLFERNFRFKHLQGSRP